MTSVDNNGRNAEATTSSPPSTFWACWPRRSGRQRRAASIGRPRSRALSSNGKAIFRRWPSAYQAVEPPASVKTAIDRRLFATGGAAPSNACSPACGRASPSGAGWPRRPSPPSRSIVAVPYINRRSAPQARLVASLAADGSDVSYLAVYDAGDRRGGAVACLGRTRRRPRLRAVDGRGPECAGLDGRHPGRRRRAARRQARDARPSSTQGAVLAISLEPTGGSTDGHRPDRRGRRRPARTSEPI